jgi:hypothetical protein
MANGCSFLMGGVFNKITSLITQVLDLTYFSRSQRSKFEKDYKSWCILLLFYLECSNLVWICTWVPSTFTPNFGPIGFQIWNISWKIAVPCLVIIICFRSHFVARGIDLKLCTCVPLGHGTYQTEIWSARFFSFFQYIFFSIIQSLHLSRPLGVTFTLLVIVGLCGGLRRHTSLGIVVSLCGGFGRLFTGYCCWHMWGLV